MMPKIEVKPKKSERGVALVVSSVLLTSALVLAVFSMRGAVTEESMAANYRHLTMSRMGAESAASFAVNEVFLGEIEINSASFPAREKQEILSWRELSESSDAITPDCGDVSCAYVTAYLDDENEFEKTPGYYIVSMGAVLSGDSVVSESGPLFVNVDVASLSGGVPLGFLRAALTVFGGIEEINRQGNNWFPTSSPSAIRGGTVEVVGPDGNLVSVDIKSMYYEGEQFNESRIPGSSGRNFESPFTDGLDEGGSSEQVMLDSMTWLEFVYNTVKGQENLVTTMTELQSKLVGKDDECTPANTQFAVIEGSFNISGQNKFCGVLIYLGDILDLSGTVRVDGFAIVANPKTNSDGSPDFSQVPDEIDIDVSGGGGVGSVIFDLEAAKNAFDSVFGEFYENTGSSFVDFIFNPTDEDPTLVGGDPVPKLSSWF